MPTDLATTRCLHTRRRWLAQMGACAGAWASAALPRTVWALDKPAGPVVLTVAGRVRIANDEGRANFDMSMLEALPQQTFTTRTPWFANPRRFTGPLLRDVLSAAGAQGTLLRLVALNDYRVEMPYEDAQRYGVIVARLLDDKPMGVREKGPLFVIYPFDQQPELKSALYYSRSAWQLRTIDVS